MTLVRIGQIGSVGAVVGALLWVAGFVWSLSYEGGLPAHVDGLLYVGLATFLVSIFVIIGTAAAILVRSLGRREAR